MPYYSSITTAFAPVWLVLLHSNFLKKIGITSQYYFLDRPEFYTDEERGILNSNCNVIFCDDSYWKKLGGRPNSIAQRQLANLAYAGSNFESKWFFHVDLDEFPYFQRSVDEILNGLVPEVREVRIQNVERVVPVNSTLWCDGILRQLCSDKALLDLHYGQRATFLGMGLTSYIHGKSMVKNGPRVGQQIHGAVSKIPGIEVVRYCARPTEAILVHYPMLSPAHLIERLRRRMNPTQRMFTHEHRLNEYLRSQENKLEAIKRIVSALHYSTQKEAEQWIEAGLCTEMPDSFKQCFKSVCEDERHLTFQFMEQSFQEFFSRRPVVSA
jgi:hypothetical protein